MVPASTLLTWSSAETKQPGPVDVTKSCWGDGAELETVPRVLGTSEHDVATDGEGFLLAEPVHAGTEEPSIRIVQNWFAEFKDRE